MTKQPMSASVEEDLVEAVDQAFSNRSDAVRKGLYHVIMDTDMLENALEDKKDERDEAIREKQRQERVIERKRDEIRDMERAIDRARTMQKAREAIDEQVKMRINELFKSWRSEWRKGDPRAPTKEELLEKQADRIAGGVSGVEADDVKRVLMAEFGV